MKKQLVQKIGGNLKARRWGTLKECEFECCNTMLGNVFYRGCINCAGKVLAKIAGKFLD